MQHIDEQLNKVALFAGMSGFIQGMCDNHAPIDQKRLGNAVRHCTTGILDKQIVNFGDLWDEWKKCVHE